MRRQAIRWLNISSSIIILFSFGADTSLLRFVLIGEVPGSSVIASPNQVLGFYAVIAFVTALYLTFDFTQLGQMLKRSSVYKSRLPQKRFTAL